MAIYKRLNEKDYEFILALADCGMKWKVAAKALDMHRSSATYRLEKIYNITGLDPRNFYDLRKLVEMAKADKEQER